VTNPRRTQASTGGAAIGVEAISGAAAESKIWQKIVRNEGSSAQIRKHTDGKSFTVFR
jgi:hypothetical protein